MSEIVRTYSELIKLPTFLERYEYLRIGNRVGQETFGFDRYLNQALYHSNLWRPIRDKVITRDLGRDLAMVGYEIHGRIHIHHMNPITKEDIVRFNDDILDPEFLICTSPDTHSAIHYGDSSRIFTGLAERKPNDTCPWKI